MLILEFPFSSTQIFARRSHLLCAMQDMSFLLVPSLFARFKEQHDCNLDSKI